MATVSTMMAPPEVLKQYFNSPVLSDITIIFGDHQVRAHKIVLVTTSGFFKAAFEGRFAESQFKEVTLHDDDPAAVMGMLRHMYSLSPYNAGAKPDIHFDLALFTVAGKYDVPTLTQCAVDDVRTYFRSEDREDAKAKIIQDVYENVPAHGCELRQVVRMEFRGQLIELMRTDLFREVLFRVPGLAVDVLEEVAQSDGEFGFGESGRACERCG